MSSRSKLSVGMRLPLSAGSRPGPGASIRYPACERPKLANASPVPNRVTVMGAPFDAARFGFIAAAYAIIITRTAQTRRAVERNETQEKETQEKDSDVKPTMGFTLPRWSTQRRMRRFAP